MPDPASADFVGTGRFAFNNAAANRRELVNGGDLLKDRSVPPQKLSRDAFPPDIRPGPSGEKPSWHDEPDKDAHEKGTPPSLGDPQRYDRVARADHNHDFTYQRVGMTQVSGTAPAEYVAPFYDAGEGPHPAATPAEPHKRIANWSVYPDYIDRIKGGAIEVWTETSVDAGATWREPVQRAVVPPGSISAEYEVRDVDLDPATYVVEPQVRVYVKPVGHDQDPALKVVRAGVDGKIDEDFLPTAALTPPMPPGAVIMYGADPAPLSPLWLLCNGQFVVQVTYPALFALIGHNYNGGVDPGDGTFKLPDFQSKFPRGAATPTAPAGTGGSDTHDHGGATGSQVGTRSDGGAGLTATAAHTHTISSASNVPAWVGVNFLIKT